MVNEMMYMYIMRFISSISYHGTHMVICKRFDEGMIYEEDSTLNHKLFHVIINIESVDFLDYTSKEL